MPSTRMLINYVPGEECRVAIVEDGKLEEFHAERVDAVSRVNNIYVGKVTNVEAGIQAAFVDFGVEENGFLHVSDLHPRYFPGEEDATEQVGKKTPRRERPPLQECLKRGQEVIVQVLKEGVGTKGPTLTSYLSIPGRYLVMMPLMDKVGVSRKVEDEEQRAKMREILDQLELPDGFGFILRTAGFERTKAELKRDLAYLLRLWKDMEQRLKQGKKPRLLYSESDLLVRALRDFVTNDVSEIVIDDEGALKRASRFMKIVAPRSSVKLLQYTGRRPLFHAFGVEQQISNMHAREVPLPSGGRLVIDETEAVVAIDVNSGKSRSARDAETNAYRTNLEAADEICRQIRLRDLGGIVINDLIDMRASKHRKAIEQRYRERLKRDRAKSTILPISGFGILEMTRQRMRGSHESVHFHECPTCHGRGLVQRPASVASDALRELAALLEYEQVSRVELVVSPRVAGELLSNKRRSLSRVERRSGKHADVRVSETLPVDRFSLYAYDASGADIDVSRLPAPKAPESELRPWEDAPGDEAWALDPGETPPPEVEAAEEEHAAEPEPMPHPIEMEEPEEGGESTGEGGGKKKRRRRRRRRKGAGEGTASVPAEGAEAAATAAPVEGDVSDDAPASAGESAPADSGEGGGKKKRRRRRRRRKGTGESGSELSGAEVAAEGAPAREPGEGSHAVEEEEASGDVPPDDGAAQGESGLKKKRRRRRRRRGGGGGSEGGGASDGVRGDGAERTPGLSAPASTQSASPNGQPAPKPQPRTLYAASRRRLLPSEKARLKPKEE
ncbi:MAG: Rne/Rng family ribonuclease [Phycisphaeraceae bacterium]|nr:Rne/Rng family ribonuclease [Phycisphaeraceae bacterium]